MIPYLNTYSLDHIENFRDLITLLEMSTELNIEIFKETLHYSIGQLLSTVESVLLAVITKDGRRKIKSYFKTHEQELHLSAKLFMKALQAKNPEIFVSVGVKALILLLRLMIILS